MFHNRSTPKRYPEQKPGMFYGVLGEVVLAENSTSLELSLVSRSDTGEYTCIAENYPLYGNVIYTGSQAINISVTCKYLIIIYSTNNLITVVLLYLLRINSRTNDLSDNSSQ